MKVAFFFDTVLLEDNSKFYGMTLTYDFFRKRYLKYFDEIVVSTRAKSIDKEKGNIDGYRMTNGESVEVKPIRYYNDIPDALKNRNKIMKEVKAIVDSSDKIIVRMPSVIGMFACDVARKCNKPYLVEMVACPWDGYINHARFGGKILAPIMSLLTKKYLKLAPNVLYVTSNFLQGRYPSNGKQISCSDVELNDFDDNILNERIKRIDKFDNNVIKLGTVASVQLKYKGQEYVFHAISELKKRGKKIDYYLAGGGDNSRLKKFVEDLNIEEEVHFLGSLPHEEVFDLVDKIDIYIQPSLQEGLPRALVEAMSRACPAVGSNAGGIPELLEEKVIFKKKNVKQIVNILENIDKETLVELSKHSF
ncbi:MAG: glycosyltransferase family 4 protein, partial [Bacilli bacterium]|nr:glycosyltransferase family 4 protein [Bacilli bacterium]